MTYESIRQICEEAVEKRQATFLRAEILDRDNQPLATGEATPEAEGVHQVFYIQNPKVADILSSRAAILRRSDGTEADILRCELCSPSGYSPHFHLEVRPS